MAAPASKPPDVLEREKPVTQQQNLPKSKGRPFRQKLGELVMKQPEGVVLRKKVQTGRDSTAYTWRGLKRRMDWLNPLHAQLAYAQNLTDKTSLEPGNAEDEKVPGT